MKVYVIGGGPAGMMAAIAAHDSGEDVILIEKNEKLGKKLYVTGKGRCNVTNYSSFDNYMKNIPVNNKFLYSALKNFDCEDTMALIESENVPLKTERGNRVFPQSDKSSDIIKAFVKAISDREIRIKLNETVKSLVYNDGSVSSIITDKNQYNDVKAVILATGGVSYPATGSTGDGYFFAKIAGHNIVNPKPSLVGFYLKDVIMDKKYPFEDFSYLQGISLKNVRADIIKNGKAIYSEFGEMLFTDKGVSGPIILTLSSYVNKLDLSDITLKIDLKPALSNEELDDRLLRDFKELCNKDFKNSLNMLLPSGLIPFIVEISGIDGNKKVNSLTKEERKILLDLLKELTFTIDQLEPIERAVVTSGGINVKEIEPSTMRSKLINNLYFAGEVIDVDALTGGYNIQIALSTGYTAGIHIK